MKNFVLFFVLFGVFSTGFCNKKRIVPIPPDKSEKITEAITKCMSDTGTSAEMLSEMLENNYVETENSRKFVHCSYGRAGYMNENGRVKIAETSEVFSNDPGVKAVLETCDKETGKGPEENINAFFKCFLEKTPVQIAL